jgi:4-hydroxy-tetrahydrodipicolinate reductase
LVGQEALRAIVDRPDLRDGDLRVRRPDACRVVIEGDPRLECEVEFTNATGDNLAGGFGIAAMRAINAIPVVVDATPGVLSVFDLPVIKGHLSQVPQPEGATS